MSEILIIYTSKKQPELKHRRMGYIEIKTPQGWAYYREALNTPWMHINSRGELDISEELTSDFKNLIEVQYAKVAFLILRRRESLEMAVARGLGLSLLKTSTDSIQPNTVISPIVNIRKL